MVAMATKTTGIMLLAVCSALSNSAHAATVQASASIENSKYFGGTNLTDHNITVSLASDWSFDQGLFSGFECYTSNANIRLNLSSGCDIYVGYFTPLNNDQALTLQAKQHKYVHARNSRWDFTELDSIFHLDKRTNLSLSYTDDWLGRGFTAYSIGADTRRAITGKLSGNMSLNLTNFDSSAAISSIAVAKASLEYNIRRWTLSASIIANDRDLERMLPFPVQRPEFGLSVTYRLY